MNKIRSLNFVVELHVLRKIIQYTRRCHMKPKMSPSVMLVTELGASRCQHTKCTYVSCKVADNFVPF